MAGAITAWFLGKEAPNFGIVQMMVALLVSTLVAAVIAFWRERWKVNKDIDMSSSVTEPEAFVLAQHLNAYSARMADLFNN